MIKNKIKESLPDYKKYKKNHIFHWDKIARILIDGKYATLEVNRYYQDAICIN